MTLSKCSNFQRAVARAALAVFCATILTGCVLVPVPTALADPEPFTAETLAPIQLGDTTRDQVRSLFADWNYTTDEGVQIARIEPEISNNGRYWVFGLLRQVGDWAWAGLALYTPVPIPVIVDVEVNYERYWVLVKFNDTDTVEAFWIAHENMPCEAGGVCYRNGHLLLLVNAAANATVQTSAPKSDRCVVYTYARDEFDTPVRVVDGMHVDEVFGKTSFLRSEISPGRSTISASIEESAETNIKSVRSASDVSVTCTGNEVLYVELDRLKKKIVAIQVDQPTGAHAIANRFLVAQVAPVSAPPLAFAVASNELNTGLTTPVHFSLSDRGLAAGQICAPPQPGAVTNCDLNTRLTAPVSLPLADAGPSATAAAADSYRRAVALIATRNPDAWPLLCTAAASGHAGAQTELGFWQRADLKVPEEFSEPLKKDNRLAYVWYRLAELNGGDATNARQYVASLLTDEELIQANEMVRNGQTGECPLRSIAP